MGASTNITIDDRTFDNIGKNLTNTFMPIVGAGRFAQDELIDKPKKAAKELADRQLAAQNKMEQQMYDSQAKADAESARDVARAKQRAQTAGSAGRRGTILTSPLGVVGDASTTGGKSALGV